MTPAGRDRQEQLWRLSATGWASAAPEPRPVDKRPRDKHELELLASFGSLFAVKLVGELRGHEARLGGSSFAAYVLAEH